MRKLLATIATTVGVTAALTAPQSLATPPGELPSNGTITVDSTTVTGNTRITVTVTPDPGVSYADGTKMSFKFDDGKGYSDSLDHGRGVINKNEVHYDAKTGQATFTLKCVDFAKSEVPNGKHWLRVLGMKDGKKISAKSEANITYTGCANN